MNILACDLGGTRMKFGLVRDGRVLAQSAAPAHSKHGLAAQLPVIAGAWRRLLAEFRLSPAECSGVSVAFPSLMDPVTGRVLDDFGKFPDATGIDLREWAQAELGLPLAIENDARMAMIGEWQFGAGRGCDDLVMMTLGTGVGVSALIEGRVLRGRHGQAGVLGGHTTVRYDGRRCTCGNIGCAEAEASTASLSDLAQGRADYAGSALAREPMLDFAAVFRHAAQGDGCSVALQDHSLRVWSSLAVSLIHLCDPELLIVGGGIMASAEAVLPALREHIARHAHTPWGRVRVAASELGDAAALAAGEWLVREQLKR